MNLAIIRKETGELIASIQGESVICQQDFIAIKYPENQEQEFVEDGDKVYLHSRYKVQLERKK